MKELIIRFFLVSIILVLALVSYDQRHFYLSRFGFYVVESKSMLPAFNRGDLLIVNKSNEYKIGDIITYRYPLEPSRFMTHRIVGVNKDVHLYYQTKGDANETDDPWQVRSDFVLGKLSIKIKYLGYPILWIKNPVGLLVLIIIPVLAICFWEVKNIIKNDSQIFLHYWEIVRNKFDG